MCDPVRVGVIGTGFMGKAHCLAYGAVKATFGNVPRPFLATLCDIEPELLAAKADEYGFRNFSTDWRAVVADPSIDAVSITTPNRTHRDMAVEALSAGKHVWCEKPMGLSVGDAEDMVLAARRSGKVALLGYNYIHNPVIKLAKRMIEEGAIGQVFDIRGQIDEDYMAGPDVVWSWRMLKREAGLGVLGDLMCHLVSLAFVFNRTACTGLGADADNPSDAARLAPTGRCGGRDRGPGSCAGPVREWRDRDARIQSRRARPEQSSPYRGSRHKRHDDVRSGAAQ